MVVLKLVSNGYVKSSDSSTYTVVYSKSRLHKFNLELLHNNLMSINARVIQVLLCIRLIKVNNGRDCLNPGQWIIICCHWQSICFQVALELNKLHDLLE